LAQVLPQRSLTHPLIAVPENDIFGEANMKTRHFSAIIPVLLLTIGTVFVSGNVWVQAKGPPTRNDAPILPANSAMMDEDPFEDFDPANFDNPTTIDNEWFPLQPGMQLIYEGSTTEDDEVIPHRVVTTVTDLIKEIDGVYTVVLWDQDFSDDVLVETEIAFFAQDNDGNIWRLGEYPEEYEDGEIVDAPAWITGQQDAVAGIAIQADPQLDTPSYSQGWAPEVEFTDRAQVEAMGETLCGPLDCYENVLVVDEFNPDEPDAHQLKLYAPGVGLVRVDWSGENETSQEFLELVEVVQLDEEGLADARAAALELEQRAYETRDEVFGETAPAEQMMP
jgi:hypothetical protein